MSEAEAEVIVIGPSSTEGAEAESSDLPLPATFLREIINKKGNKSYIYKCHKCTQEISCNPASLSNVKRHLETIHHLQLTKRRKTDADINSKVADFVISSNSALRIVEDPKFHSLFKGEERQNLITTTKSLKILILKKFEEFHSSVKTKLSEVTAVAVTADAWSSYNKSYLGITASWYDDKTLKRNMAILALRRSIEKLTFNEIRQHLIDVFEEYGIRDRVKAITTDNGSNFIKCMTIFGEPSQDPEEIANDDFEIRIIEIEDLEGTTVSSALPKHIRCAAHRLNLVARSFETKLDHESAYWKNYDKIHRKCRNLWNAQGRSPKMSDFIRTLCGSLFVVPTSVRWNSLIDAYKDIVKKAKQPNINKVLNQHYQITEDDLQFLRCFVKIMNPIAIAIDTLQGDDIPYGMLFVAIKRVKQKLDDYKLEYNDHSILVLITLLQTEIDTRFSEISKCDELAAMVAPMCLQKDSSLKTLVMANGNLLLEKCTVTVPKEVNENAPDSLDDNILFSPETSQHDCKLAEFYSKKRTQKDLHDFECVKRLFIHYNTPLPTSASVERMFSQAKRVMTFDRTRLGDELFEKLTLLRCGVRTSNT